MASALSPFTRRKKGGGSPRPRTGTPPTPPPPQTPPPPPPPPLELETLTSDDLTTSVSDEETAADGFSRGALVSSPLQSSGFRHYSTPEEEEEKKGGFFLDSPSGGGGGKRGGMFSGRFNPMFTKKKSSDDHKTEEGDDPHWQQKKAQMKTQYNRATSRYLAAAGKGDRKTSMFKRASSAFGKAKRRTSSILSVGSSAGESPRARRRVRISTMAQGRTSLFLGRRATVGTGGYDFAFDNITKQEVITFSTTAAKLGMMIPAPAFTDIKPEGWRSAPRIHVPFWYRVFGSLTVLFGTYYFAWRCNELSYRARDAGPGCYVLLAVEIFTWLMWLPGVISFWTTYSRPAVDLKPEDHRPTVDVVVPCCGEPEDIIKDTVLAALALDYPRQRFTVYCCDDGGSDALKDWVMELKDIKCQRVEYVRRRKTKGVAHHAKAGNLNHVISITNAEFIACFDADMLADPAFLNRTIPHMSDHKIALVQTPQAFYNVPADDPLSHNMSFVNMVLAAADSHQSCPCIGTGWLLRRESLKDIGGGFTYGSVAEDFNTTMSLHTAGWSSLYVNDQLQWGLAPDTMTGTVLQRQRWCMGNIQMLLMRPFSNNKLTFLQRVLYTGGGFAYVAQCFILIYALVPVLSNFGVDFITADAVWYPRLILTYLCITNLSAANLMLSLKKLCSTMPKESAERVLATLPVTQVRDTCAAFWMAPWIMVAVWRVLCPFEIAFQVTGAASSAWMMDLQYVLPHIAYCLAAVAAWIYSFANLDTQNCLELGAFCTFSLFQAFTLQLMSPPIIYVIKTYKNPPPDRTKFLIYDESGTPTVNHALRETPPPMWQYNIIPVVIIFWFALTVYVTTAKSTLGYGCKIETLEV